MTISSEVKMSPFNWSSEKTHNCLPFSKIQENNSFGSILLPLPERGKRQSSLSSSFTILTINPSLLTTPKSTSEIFLSWEGIWPKNYNWKTTNWNIVEALLSIWPIKKNRKKNKNKRKRKLSSLRRPLKKYNYKNNKKREKWSLKGCKKGQRRKSKGKMI